MIQAMKKSSRSRVKADPVIISSTPATLPVSSPVQLAKTLCQKALLLKVSIACYAGMKKDKRLSAQVTADANSQVNLVRVWKSLLRGDEMNNVINLSQKLRMTYYRLTAPWGEDGSRIVRCVNYTEVKMQLEALKREYLTAVQKATDAYDAMLLADQTRLGSAFEASDYPSKVEFSSRFGAKIEVMPVPSSDYRSGVLDKEETDEINAQIEELAKDRVKQANREALQRMIDSISHLHSRLADKEAQFKGNSIQNVLDSASEAQALNVSDDVSIDTLAATIKSQFSKIDADVLRINEAERLETANAAKKTLDSIIGAMESFA